MLLCKLFVTKEPVCCWPLFDVDLEPVSAISAQVVLRSGCVRGACVDLTALAPRALTQTGVVRRVVFDASGVSRRVMLPVQKNALRLIRCEYLMGGIMRFRVGRSAAGIDLVQCRRECLLFLPLLSPPRSSPPPPSCVRSAEPRGSRTGRGRRWRSRWRGGSGRSRWKWLLRNGLLVGANWMQQH